MAGSSPFSVINFRKNSIVPHRVAVSFAVTFGHNFPVAAYFRFSRQINLLNLKVSLYSLLL